MQSARCVRRKKLFIALSSQLDHHTWNKKGQPLIFGSPSSFMHYLHRSNIIYARVCAQLYVSHPCCGRGRSSCRGEYVSLYL